MGPAIEHTDLYRLSCYEPDWLIGWPGQTGRPGKRGTQSEGLQGNTGFGLGILAFSEKLDLCMKTLQVVTNKSVRYIMK